MTVNEFIAILQALPENEKSQQFEFYNRAANTDTTSLFLAYEDIDVQGCTTYINLNILPEE